MSWIAIEQLREEFYQVKMLNRGVHFHASLLQSLTDASQIDQEISGISFQRSIRPFLFELSDQRQFLQLLVYYMHFINGLPMLDQFQELANPMKISLPNHVHEQLFIEQEFLKIYPLIHPGASKRTEKHFSFDYISRVYEQIIAIPSIKSYKIQFILLYWYYLAENVVELRQQSKSPKSVTPVRLYPPGAKSLRYLACV